MRRGRNSILVVAERFERRVDQRRRAHRTKHYSGHPRVPRSRGLRHGIGTSGGLAAYNCDNNDDATAQGIATNTAGGYDVLFADGSTNKSVVRRFSNDGASTASSLILNAVPAMLATDRGGHDYLDTSAGRILMYTATATDPAATSSDVTLAGNPQLGPIAVSPGADRTIYVVTGVSGQQNIDVLATGSPTVTRTIGPFGDSAIGALAVGADGTLYVALNPIAPGAGSFIRAYSSTATGKPLPLRTIVPTPSSVTIDGLAIDPNSATLYASHSTSIDAFPLTGNGQIPPSRTITPNTQQTKNIVGIAVSADGTLDILENRTQQVSCAERGPARPGRPARIVIDLRGPRRFDRDERGFDLVTGDSGVSPGTAVTGFGPGTVTNGSIHAGDPAAAQAEADLATAYGNAAARTNPNAVPADIGGLTLPPGLYQAPVSLANSGALTLDGQNNPNAVWIFQIPSTLTTAVNSSMTMINRGNACNVFWQVGSSATINTASVVVGTVMSASSISLGTGASVNGRVMAKNGAVTMLSNTVTVTGP